MSGNLKCGICLVFPSFSEDDHFVNTKCGHVFHYECLNTVAPKAHGMATCPQCAKKLTLKRLVKIQGISPIPSGVNRSNSFKFIILGDHGTGKTCLLKTFVQGAFPEGCDATLGCDIYFKTIEMSGHIVKLSIWDSAGQEKYFAIVPNYFRNVDGILMVYDVTSKAGLASIEKWMDLIKDNAPESTSVILVGNKIDKGQERQTSFDKGSETAKSLGIHYAEVSAKENFNVESLYRSLTAYCLENYWRDTHMDSNTINTNTNKESESTIYNSNDSISLTGANGVTEAREPSIKSIKAESVNNDNKCSC